MLLAAAAWIVDLQGRIVADGGEEFRIEKSAVVGELGQLIAVAETARFMADGERERQHLAGSQRLLERIERIQIARRAAHQVKRPVEAHSTHRLVLIRQMNLGNRLRALVLQSESPGAVEGAPIRID